MPTQPLQPFAPPANVLAHLPAGMLSASTALTWLLYAVFAFWAVYTLVIVYHWLRYSHDSHLAIPSIAVHLAVSAAIMTYALTGVIFG
ncbi:MAG: hypothetical protein B7W98_03630 [Parcubacteria group bacterium 20-58-5]|nr:MAG: hypothetical protein B7W98_03630 [Parcubacteria group bacterium 20-58-5]